MILDELKHAGIWTMSCQPEVFEDGFNSTLEHWFKAQ
jgi:hypothetical protein